MTRVIELHVWGNANRISLIDPESRALAWLLSLCRAPCGVDVKIVPSSNTNIADSRKLPVLLVKKGSVVRKYEGFVHACCFICDEFEPQSCFVRDGDLSSYKHLINIGLIDSINNKLQYINQYNLYINSKNYELYTRKLFSQYLPFPMMYNQPLRFYNDALDQVQTIGLSSGKTGFFSLRNSGDTPETEAVPESDEENEDEVALSALHEKALIKKEKHKSLMKEKKNALRCLGLLNGFVSHVIHIFEKLNPDAGNSYGNLFEKDNFSTSELLLYSYIFSLTNEELPDRFVAFYLEKKFPNFWDFAISAAEKLNQSVRPSDFRAPTGPELPSLMNEFAYQVGLYKY